MDKTLVIMAAGIGSRYGAGIKQLAKMTSNDETIIDFSVYDAIKAGFNKVVFIIRKDIEEDFKNIIGDRISKHIDIAYAFQELDDLPHGLQVPEGRKKPWGTVHALLAAKDHINSPFLVINADDYYGESPFKAMSQYLSEDRDQSEKYTMAMVGYKLKNTLSDNGSVTRGVCVPTEDSHLEKIIETKGIKLEDGKIVSSMNLTEDILNLESTVSMNTWAGYPDLLEYVEESFNKYILDNKEDLSTVEYVLPTMIDEMISKNLVDIKILPTHEKWIGITYREDLESAQKEFKDMLDKGFYPDGLWNNK